MTRDPEYTNELARETSPYLLQHAHNPVDWHPWNAEALRLAQEQDRPILLSIGYSACHWCHVMAHESFEDPATAEVMNRLFVNIKVDREERPDLDRIYQAAHSLLLQRPGGWPLTLFLTPGDLVPFFGGTYFPPRSRYGLPGFRDLLERVAAYYRDNPDEIRQQNRRMTAALAAVAAPGEARPPASLALDVARRQLGAQFDPVHGGFGRAPKFPQPAALERLLRHWHRSGQRDREALDMVLLSLERMARGGLFDQLGGGFCRYSVDDTWTIPHFEKMLYDNAALLPLYAQAWAASGRPLFRRVALATAAWVMREMQSPEGGYWSSLDADSEGGEGRFYLWTREQVQGLLGAEAELARARFGLDGRPNFEDRWHLVLAADAATLARRFGTDEADIRRRLEGIEERMFAAREQRPRPARDDKVLTAWNGLMIRGMAIAARHLEAPELAASADRALDFVRDRLWRDGRLLATWRDGRARLNACLDDYVFLADALVELLQYRWRSEDLELARRLAESLLAHFQDPAGGFWFTADDHEPLIQRPKPAADDALPSGNAVAARVLGRLGQLLGEPRYLEAARGTLEAMGAVMEENPTACASLLTALEEHLYPPDLLVLRGREPELAAWQRWAGRGYRPDRLVFAIPADAAGLPPALAAHRPEGAVGAWLCSGGTCRPPVTDEAAFRALLGEEEVAVT